MLQSINLAHVNAIFCEANGLDVLVKNQMESCLLEA